VYLFLECLIELSYRWQDKKLIKGSLVSIIFLLLNGATKNNSNKKRFLTQLNQSYGYVGNLSKPFLSLTEAYYVEHKQHGAILTFIAFIILVWKILISIFICIFRHNVRHASLYMLVLNRISSRYQGQGLIFQFCEAYNICT